MHGGGASSSFPFSSSQGGQNRTLIFLVLILVVFSILFSLITFHNNNSSSSSSSSVFHDEQQHHGGDDESNNKAKNSASSSTRRDIKRRPAKTATTTVVAPTAAPTTEAPAPETEAPVDPELEIKPPSGPPPSLLDESLPKVHFISFASKEFECSLARIHNEASQTTIFQTIRLYTEENLGRDYLDFVDTKKHKRGFGYWSWKPYLMAKRLDAGDIHRNEILVFADAGCTISPYPNSLMADINHLINSDGDLVVRHLETKHTLERWIKGDAFAAFNVTPSTLGDGQLSSGPVLYQGRDREGSRLRFVPPRSRLGVMPMFLGGILVARYTPRLRKLLGSWLQNMLKDNLRAVSDAKSTLQLDSPHFQDHRHDQAVLSLMIYTRAPFTEGIRPREDDTWVPGGAQQWRYLARSGVFILATRYKECHWLPMFSPKQYQFVRYKRWMRWFN